MTASLGREAAASPPSLAVLLQDPTARRRNTLPILLQAREHAHVVRNGALAKSAHISAKVGRIQLQLVSHDQSDKT